MASVAGSKAMTLKSDSKFGNETQVEQKVSYDNQNRLRELEVKLG